MTNVRSATRDQTAVIKTPRILTLKNLLSSWTTMKYMEVTPESIRLRKQILNKAEREKANKRKNQQLLNNTERKENQNGLFYLREFWFSFYLLWPQKYSWYLKQCHNGGLDRLHYRTGLVSPFFRYSNYRLSFLSVPFSPLLATGLVGCSKQKTQPKK